MNTLRAATGWAWIRQGFALFRKQPAELSTLFLSYMFLMLAIGYIPVLGAILPLMLVPVFSMGFMQACVQIEQNKRVYPNLLLTGFRSPAFGRLMTLGLLYLIAAMIAVGVSSLVDGGTFWRVMTGRVAIDEKSMAGTSAATMLVAALTYIPAAMGFWYAAPLMAWQNMSLPKALFYSFFAVRRSGRAFLIFLLAWIGLAIVIPLLIDGLLAPFLGKELVLVAILLPLSIVMTVIMYCSFYPTYIEIFGRPDTGKP